MLAGGTWLERGRHELEGALFQVPSYREIFEWLKQQPGGSPIPGEAQGLSPRATEVLQQLLERTAREAAAGLEADASFAAALEALRARAVEQALPPVTDIQQRQHVLGQLSSQERHRLQLRKAARRSKSDPSSYS
jgi:hypothetical protein